MKETSVQSSSEVSYDNLAAPVTISGFDHVPTLPWDKDDIQAKQVAGTIGTFWLTVAGAAVGVLKLVKKK